MHFIWFTYASHLLSYWGTVAYCVFRDPIQQWDRDCFRVVLRNMVLYTVPAAAIFARLFPEEQYDHIGIWHAIWQLPVSVLLTDVLFYYPHRALHQVKIGPLNLYRLHKAHHKWKRPLGMAALYADFFEHIVVNTAPPLAAGMILRSHPVVLALWAAIASGNTVRAHAIEGQHIDHHTSLKHNFGVGLMLCDRMHGTLLEAYA